MIVCILMLYFLWIKGGRIEATVGKQFIRKFDSCVVEGEVYKVTDFAIIKNLGKFRATSHGFKLVFNATTKLLPTLVGSIPFHGLSFLKTSDIMKTKGHSDYLLDYMGILTAVSDEMTMTSRDGRGTRLMQLELVDETGEIRCAIFGDLIDVVAGLLALPRVGLPVVILQVVRVNKYKGEVGIQNVMNATKILWEPDIPEAIQFKQELAVHEVESDLKVGMLPKSKTIVPLRDDFFKLYPRKTLCQLVETEEEGYFTTVATISKICDDYPWWYMACSCMRAVTQIGVAYFCKDCNLHMFNAMPRYKLKLDVSDGDDLVRLVLFDGEAVDLLNRSCKELVIQSKVESDCDFPEEISMLVGKEVLFKVEKTAEASSNFDGSLKVKRVCSDPLLIDEYKQRLCEDTPLKQKFAPFFPKLGNGEESSGTKEIKVESCSVITEIDVTPLSYGQPSNTPDAESIISKREATQSLEPAPERKRRAKVKPVKFE
ncbi:hypothetical protein SESBI_47785 [Sesbania bispinosa]|nr:hypothetical protein SESBI_47785 [Sesbania bispinosa]